MGKFRREEINGLEHPEELQRKRHIHTSLARCLVGIGMRLRIVTIVLRIRDRGTFRRNLNRFVAHGCNYEGQNLKLCVTLWLHFCYTCDTKNMQKNFLRLLTRIPNSDNFQKTFSGVICRLSCLVLSCQHRLEHLLDDYLQNNCVRDVS